MTPAVDGVAGVMRCAVWRGGRCRCVCVVFFFPFSLLLCHIHCPVSSPTQLDVNSNQRLRPCCRHVAGDSSSVGQDAKRAVTEDGDGLVIQFAILTFGDVEAGGRSSWQSLGIQTEVENRVYNPCGYFLPSYRCPSRETIFSWNQRITSR